MIKLYSIRIESTFFEGYSQNITPSITRTKDSVLSDLVHVLVLVLVLEIRLFKVVNKKGARPQPVPFLNSGMRTS